MSDLLARLMMGTQVPEFELRMEAALEIERLTKALSSTEDRLNRALDGWAKCQDKYIDLLDKQPVETDGIPRLEQT